MVRINREVGFDPLAQRLIGLDRKITLRSTIIEEAVFDVDTPAAIIVKALIDVAPLQGSNRIAEAGSFGSWLLRFGLRRSRRQAAGPEPVSVK